MAKEEDQNYEEELSHEEILEEYRRRKMLEHMVGPVISIVVHVVIIIACAVFLVGKPAEETSAFEFDSTEEDVKELEQELDEELDDMEEEEIREEVPEMEKPEMESEDMEQETDFEDPAQTDTSVEVDNMMEATSSPLTMKGVFGNRGEEGRKKAREKHGGNKYTERAVLKALRWLEKEQNSDGSWGNKHKEAMTGLALLTFLAHGETPQSDEFGDTLSDAIQWLTKHMENKSGVGSRDDAYMNGISTYALCEAYGLTQIPAIKPAMEKGLEFLIKGQQDDGGWDYGYSKGKRWDLSVAGWQLQALKAGQAAGADVDGAEETIEKGIKWLKEVSYKNGKFHYSGEGSQKARSPHPSMQGIGVLCLQLLGHGDSDEAETVSEHIEDNISVSWEKPPRFPMYTWYYCTQAMFHAGKSSFDGWNDEYAPMIVKNQHKEGYWKPLEDHGGVNKIYATTLSALSLQVYYRYLPTYEDPGKSEKSKNVLEMDDEDEDLGLDIE